MPAPLSRFAVSLLVLGLIAVSPLQTQEPFPHDRHEGLFPLCQGCHQVDTGDPADLYPPATQCRHCHDGEQAAEVSWSPPRGAPDYRHPAHQEATGIALACGDCHGDGGGVALTGLTRSCERCHTDHHSAGARCRVCHQGPVVGQHELDAHGGCGDCHEAEWAPALTFNRELCLLCHRELEDHRPGRQCGQCHGVGQPGSASGAGGAHFVSRGGRPSAAGGSLRSRGAPAARGRFP